MKKRAKSFALVIALIFAIGLGAVLFINSYVQQVGSQYIVSADKAPKADAILVLGAYVYPNGTVSTMLNDRLTTAFTRMENHRVFWLAVIMEEKIMMKLTP